jgi:hypothetical protein
VPADRRVAAGPVSLTLAMALGACGEPPARPEAAPSTTVVPTTTRAAAPSSTRPPSRPSPPVRVEIPAIGVSGRLVRLGLNADGTMQVAGDHGLAGWFTGGAMPGQDGPAVISGHVDSRTGPGRLGPVTGPVLRLITCGGDFDRQRVIRSTMAQALLGGRGGGARPPHGSGTVSERRQQCQSAIRRATAGLILDAWRAGQAVAAREATAVAATSRVMCSQGMGNGTPAPWRSSSLRNSR